MGLILYRLLDDNLYFSRYFTQKAAREKKEGQLSDEDSEAESVGDDEFDEYLGKSDRNIAVNHYSTV